MEHLPEVLKILEGALKRDPSKATRYAELLASKLEQDGDSASAGHLRRTIAEIRPKALQPTSVAATAHRVPVDSESRLALATTTHPKVDDTPLVLDDHSGQALNSFIASYRGLDQLLSAGLTGPGHILLFGPPGCGKTQAARHLAARLDLPLVTSRLDGLISSFLGSTAKNIRSLFDYIENTPCIFLLDEFDAMAKMRDDPHELGELKRVVNSLLQNIDFLSAGTVVVAATNHEHLLDPAVWRRFEFHIRISQPDQAARVKLFQLYWSLDETSPLIYQVLATLTHGYSGADIRVICDSLARQTVLEGQRAFSVRHAVLALSQFRTEQTSNDQRQLLGNLDEQIRFLRSADPKLFTYDLISELLAVSKGKISNVLNRDQ